jgi:lysophospholipase L1-like esterase
MRLHKSISITILLLGIFALAELYLHIYKPSLVEFDSELGWRLKSNFDRVYQQKTQMGKEYSAHFITNQYGFRAYGDSNEKSLKILVLGDSFTGDAFSSNEQAWFSVIAQKLEANKKQFPNSVTVWAGGSGGYGTLQELILAKRIKNVFNPDALILQFCSNDFGDNHLQWQSNTVLRQLYLRRPYMNIDGRIEFSQDILAPLYRSFLFQNSRLINKFDSYVNFVEFMYFGGYQKYINPDLVKKYEVESLQITQLLLKELAYEFPRIPKIAVNCSAEEEGLNAQWQNLAKNAGFIPISQPAELIKKQLTKGEDLIHADGGHWNPLGNQLFGETLYKELNNLGLINSIASKK